jgi:glycerophosphoryl diester phosphodiesterase
MRIGSLTRPLHVRPGRPYLAGAPVFCAHRGGAALAPENTMEAFRHAVEDWGVDMLEMDVRASADGRIVVIHDATVDRTTDGTGAVARMPWGALSELDAGYRFHDLNGGASFRGSGVRLPLFEEVLEAFPRTRLNVEIKDASAAHGLVELIHRFAAEQRVLVAAEHERCRRSVRGYQGPWGASARQLVRFWLIHDTPLSVLYTPRADILQVPFTWKERTVVTRRLLFEAHRRNIPVHVWTVDEEILMRRLLELGVDGLQTDRPDRLAVVLSEQAGRPPAPALGNGRRRSGTARAG